MHLQRMFEGMRRITEDDLRQVGNSGNGLGIEPDNAERRGERFGFGQGHAQGAMAVGRQAVALVGGGVLLVPEQRMRGHALLQGRDQLGLGNRRRNILNGGKGSGRHAANVKENAPQRGVRAA